MDIQWLEFIIGAGASLVSIAAVLIGVGWRMKGMESRLKEQAEEEAYRAVKKHVDAEHTKDSEGNTLRERIGLLEATCRQRHGGT